MIDLDFNFDFARYGSEASELSLLVVVVGGVELCVLVGQLDGPDEKVVLLVRGVGNPGSAGARSNPTRVVCMIENTQEEQKPFFFLNLQTGVYILQNTMVVEEGENGC